MVLKSENLDSILNETGKIINPVVKKLLNSYVDKKTQKLVNYQILAGGKRIRPALTILSCQLLGGKIKDVLYPAAGLEILHNYSLIIDDMIDNSVVRRSEPTVWSKFGRTVTQCVGVDYSAAVFQAANRSREPVKISELFARTMKKIVDGEILDVLFGQVERKGEPYIFENRYLNIGENDFLKMSKKKTATLFQTCCEVGGICAKAKDEELKNLRGFGFNMGRALQIKDDILDNFGSEEEFGKEIGRDIREGKLGNIVILYALEEISSRDRKKFLNILKKKDVNNEEIKETIEIIGKTKAREKSLSLGKRYTEKAKKNLEFLPQNKWNDALKEITDFVIERER